MISLLSLRSACPRLTSTICASPRSAHSGSRYLSDTSSTQTMRRWPPRPTRRSSRFAWDSLAATSSTHWSPGSATCQSSAVDWTRMISVSICSALLISITQIKEFERFAIREKSTSLSMSDSDSSPRTGRRSASLASSSGTAREMSDSRRITLLTRK